MNKFSTSILMILLVFGIGLSPSVGQTKEEKKQAKEDKKKLKEEAAIAEWNESKALAASKRWVFSSNQAFSNDGSFGLDPKTNFLYVIDDEAVVQFALDGVIVRGNGVGGITIQGTVMDYKIFADKYKKPVRVDLTIRPKAGQGVGVGLISVTFYADGFAEINMNTQGFRLKGDIVTPEKSNIYQGSAF